eukprot:gene12334-14567_t
MLYTGAPDLEGPIITLLGEPRVDVQMMAVYRDEGAIATDAVDGSLRAAVTGLDAIDTRFPTPDGGPFELHYTAVDDAGNEAIPVQRWVAVVDPCTPPAFFCADLGACSSCTTSEDSEGEVCICITFLSEQEDPILAEYVPQLDVVPPVITLLGDGQLGRNAEGGIYMAHFVNQYSAFNCPGAEAWDDVDGNLTQELSQFGAGQVDTSVLTPLDAPKIVTYSVFDTAGNAAVQARRRVYVVKPCAEGETMCNDGMCMANPLQCPLGQVAEAMHNLEPNVAPELVLLGPAEVTVAQHEGYARCRNSSLVSRVCETGAEAEDVEDGLLDQYILSCSPDGLSFPFKDVGVRPCSVNTSVPGRYNVTFLVTDSAGAQATAQRTIIVEPSCTHGEHLCDTGVSCSRDGVCMDDIGAGEGLSLEVVAPGPPSIALVIAASAPSNIKVRKHARYELCEAGALPRAEGDCDPGVTAISAVSGRDLSGTVLVCPPAECLPFGCPGHELRKKRVSPCLNTSASLGTVFEVVFTVFDDNIPPQRASVSRLITIVSPCGVDEELCADDVCSSTPCDIRASLLPAPADTTGPAILIVASNQDYGRGGEVPRTQTSYGVAARWLLRVCTSWEAADLALLSDPPNCSVAAWDDMDGDVTAQLEVQQVYGAPLCTAAQQSAGCISGRACPVDSLQSGECVAGLYQYQWRVTDVSGNEAGQMVEVEVMERAIITMEVRLQSNGDDAAAAQEEALQIEAGGAEAEAVRMAVARLAEVSKADVELEGVHVEAADGAFDYYALVVTVTIQNLGVACAAQACFLTTTGYYYYYYYYYYYSSLSGHLEAAVKEMEVQGLPTNALGLAAEPEVQQTTADMDQSAAAWAALSGTAAQVHQAQVNALAQLADVEESLVALQNSAHVEGWQQTVLDTWSAGRDAGQNSFDMAQQ